MSHRRFGRLVRGFLGAERGLSHGRVGRLVGRLVRGFISAERGMSHGRVGKLFGSRLARRFLGAEKGIGLARLSEILRSLASLVIASSLERSVFLTDLVPATSSTATVSGVFNPLNDLSDLVPATTL